MEITAQFGSETFPFIEDKNGKRHFYNSEEGDTLCDLLEPGEVIESLVEQGLLTQRFDMTLTKDEVVGLRHVLGPMTHFSKIKWGCTAVEAEAVFQFFKRVARFYREIP